jgi:hypothetical protein
MRQILAVIFALLASTYALAMPAYNTTTPAPAAITGQAINVWFNETPTPGNGTTAASQQLALSGTTQKAGTPFSVDGQFSGAPGTFELDVQVAAVDSDTSYQTCSNCNITSVDSHNQTFHLDAVLVNAKFVRLLMRARGNSVSIVASVTGG